MHPETRKVKVGYDWISDFYKAVYNGQFGYKPNELGDLGILEKCWKEWLTHDLIECDINGLTPEQQIF